MRFYVNLFALYNKLDSIWITKKFHYWLWEVTLSPSSFMFGYTDRKLRFIFFPLWHNNCFGVSTIYIFHVDIITLLYPRGYTILCKRLIHEEKKEIRLLNQKIKSNVLMMVIIKLSHNPLINGTI